MPRRRTRAQPAPRAVLRSPERRRPKFFRRRDRPLSRAQGRCALCQASRLAQPSPAAFPTPRPWHRRARNAMRSSGGILNCRERAIASAAGISASGTPAGGGAARRTDRRETLDRRGAHARRRERAAARHGPRTSRAGRATVRTAVLQLPRPESGSYLVGPTCDILEPHEPHGPRDLSARSPLTRRLCAGSAIASPAGDQFLKPFAMMLPRPTAGNLPARHGADRAAQPDCRINVYDPHADDGHGG